MKRFLFYDTETSGLNPAFDQVLTFACIQTDPQLNELSRETITVKLRPDIVPSPGAFLTHGLMPEDLERGISEYEAALSIHKLLNTPGTVSIGYNSLGFDDAFLRFMFYRNLLDPYSHQYASGCSRMDLLPVAAVYKLFCSQVLSWPVRDDGTPTLKLEYISSENRFTVSGRAHEAMADVEALLNLARIFQKERNIWDYVLGFFDKVTDNRRMQELESANDAVKTDFKLGIMVSVSFGPKCDYMAPVLYLGESKPYKNQSLWLRLDSPGLFDTIDEKIGIFDLFVIRKRPADQLFILPCRKRFWARLADPAVDACMRNLEVISENSPLFSKTTAFHRDFRYPEVPDVDADADLYRAGFFSPLEKNDITLFHRSDTTEKKRLSSGFATPRIKTLSSRIIARNFQGSVFDVPELSYHMRGLSGHTSARVNGYKGDEKLTCATALAELEEIENAPPKKGSQHSRDVMIAWLKSYIKDMSSVLDDNTH